MIRSVALVALLVACHHTAPTPLHGPPPPPEGQATGNFADEDRFEPHYDQQDLDKALAAERALVETTADPADQAVRRRFVASLESCSKDGRRCPPRLDDPAWSFDPDGVADPKLDTPLRFDLDDWRLVAAELHGRACACRTIACVDSMFVAIARLETRPMPEVEADEVASLSITRARECLARLRGLTAP